MKWVLDGKPFESWENGLKSQLKNGLMAKLSQNVKNVKEWEK